LFSVLSLNDFRQSNSNTESVQPILARPKTNIVNFAGRGVVVGVRVRFLGRPESDFPSGVPKKNPGAALAEAAQALISIEALGQAPCSRHLCRWSSAFLSRLFSARAFLRVELFWRKNARSRLRNGSAEAEGDHRARMVDRGSAWTGPTPLIFINPRQKYL